MKSKNNKSSITLLITLFCVLICGGHSAGENYSGSTSYSYDNTDFQLEYEENRVIHLSLPPDEYVLRLRSEGELDIYIQPKDKNKLVDNIFIRKCDTAIVTTNTDKSVLYSPICVSGQILKNETRPKQKDNIGTTEKSHNKPIISTNLKQNNEAHTNGEISKNADKSMATDMPSKEEKYYTYYIDTITEQQIRLRCINNTLREQLENYSKSRPREGVSICGYYNISNNCPYIEVHWVGLRDDFKNNLQSIKMLDKGIFGLR